MASTEGWFLAGNSHNEEFNQGLKVLIQDMILKKQFYSPVNPNFLSYLFFHIDSDEWRKTFPEIFDIRTPLPSHRIHFSCNKISLEWKNKIPNGYDLHQIDSTFATESFEFPDDIQEWIESNLEDQVRMGFGKCLVHRNKVVVWINADCESGDECEIGIITTASYRMKGLGALTAAATIDHCLSIGFKTVGWHCDNLNYGSIAVAEKVGFTKERDYVHYICMFDEAEHYAEKGMRYFYQSQYGKAIEDFERAFKLGKVPIWVYVLAARSYATQYEVDKALRNLREAQNRGWKNWDPVLQSKEMEHIQDNGSFVDFTKTLLDEV